MIKYLLFIKGNEDDAREACNKRGIVIQDINDVSNWDCTRVASTVDSTLLYKWLQEDMYMSGEFPPGSLLFYSEVL